MPATVSTDRVVTEVLTESTTASTVINRGYRRAVRLRFDLPGVQRSVNSAPRLRTRARAGDSPRSGTSRNGWLTSFDEPLTNWMVDHRGGTLDQIAVAVTDLGSPVAAARQDRAECSYWRARSVVPGLIVIGTVGGAAVACTVVEALVGRERPPTSIQVLLRDRPLVPVRSMTGTAPALRFSL